MMSSIRWRNHPRIRGEKLRRENVKAGQSGSPPHTQGKVVESKRNQTFARITPAYAGKSSIDTRGPISSRDHPRIRGEKLLAPLNLLNNLDSPPLARGKAFLPGLCAVSIGITPACAGKSAGCGSGSTASWDHPRVRGEKSLEHLRLRLIWGSPPHTRGKAVWALALAARSGITPAYAGKSVDSAVSTVFSAGSPPHTRGKVFHALVELAALGITPAYAGKSLFWKSLKTMTTDHLRIRGEK